MSRTTTITTGAQTTRKFDTDDLLIDWARNKRGRNVDHLCLMIASIFGNGLGSAPTVTLEGSRRNPEPFVGPGFHRTEALHVLRHGIKAIKPDDRYSEGVCKQVREQIKLYMKRHGIRASRDLLPELLCPVDEFIPAIKDEKERAAERDTQMLVENLHREDATQAEIAESVCALEALGRTRKWIAAKLVKDVQWVDRAIMFGKKASKALAQASAEGDIPNTLAVDAARLPKDAQDEIVEDIKKGDKPRKALDKQRKRKGKKNLRKKPTLGALRLFFDEENIEARVTGGKPPVDNDVMCNAVARGILAGVVYVTGVSDMGPETLARQNKTTLIDLLDEALARGDHSPGAVAEKARKAAADKKKAKPAAKKKAKKKAKAKAKASK
jgi:hypothetical protein